MIKNYKKIFIYLLLFIFTPLVKICAKVHILWDKEKVISENKITNLLNEKLNTINKQEKINIEAKLREYLYELLESYGYYDSEITSIEQEKTDYFIKVKPGEYYKFSSFNYQLNEASPLKIVDLPSFSSLNLKVQEPAQASKVIIAEGLILKYINFNFYLFNAKTSHTARLDKFKKEVSIIFNVETGPNCYFGNTQFSGLQSVKEDYVTKLIPWKIGEGFKSYKLDKFQLTLLSNNLFSQAKIKLPENVKPDSQVPIDVELTEKAPKSIKAGLYFNTDIGAEANLSWHHANLFGRAEQLLIGTMYSKHQKNIELSYIKPFFMGADLTMKISTRIFNDRINLYNSKGGEIKAVFEYKIKKNLYFNSGIIFSKNHLKEFERKERESKTGGKKETFEALINKEFIKTISLPLTLSLDVRNNKLNPSAGWFIEGEASPSINFFVEAGKRSFLTKFKFSVSNYMALREESKLNPIFAWRLKSGVIISNNEDLVPVDQKYYGGGDSSIRGFAYQKISKFKRGGLSFLELSNEIRFNIKEDWGIVGFMDIGNTYHTSYYNFKEGTRIGIGAGIRYFTDFGPLRFDFAVPWEKRKNRKEPFQIYFSLGQSF